MTDVDLSLLTELSLEVQGVPEARYCNDLHVRYTSGKFRFDSSAGLQRVLGQAERCCALTPA